MVSATTKVFMKKASSPWIIVIFLKFLDVMLTSETWNVQPIQNE